MSNRIASDSRPARPAPTRTVGDWADLTEWPALAPTPATPTRADRIALAVGRLVILSVGTVSFGVVGGLLANFLYTL